MDGQTHIVILVRTQLSFKIKVQTQGSEQDSHSDYCADPRVAQYSAYPQVVQF